MPRRRVIAGTLGLVLLAIAAIVRWRSGAAASAPGTARVVPPPTLPVAARPTAAPNLALAAAREDRQRARYPHSSQPLRADQSDPILRDREPSHASFPGPNGEDPTLVVFPDRRARRRR